MNRDGPTNPPVVDLFVDPGSALKVMTLVPSCSSEEPCSTIKQALESSSRIREGTFRVILRAGTYTGPDNLDILFNNAKLEAIAGEEDGVVVVDGEGKATKTLWVVQQTAARFYLANIEFRRIDITGKGAPVAMISPGGSNAAKKWTVENLRFAGCTSAAGVAGGLFVDMHGGQKHDRFVANNVYFSQCSSRLAGGGYFKIRGGTITEVLAQSCLSLGGNVGDEWSAGAFVVDLDMLAAATGAPALIMSSLHAYENILDGDPHTLRGSGGIVFDAAGRGFAVVDSAGCYGNRVPSGDAGAEAASHFLSRARGEASLKVNYVSTRGGSLTGDTPSLAPAVVVDGDDVSHQTWFSAEIDSPSKGFAIRSAKVIFTDSTIVDSTECGLILNECFDELPNIDRITFSNCEVEVCCDASCDDICNPPDDF